jgi:hypothetical protein
VVTVSRVVVVVVVVVTGGSATHPANPSITTKEKALLMNPPFLLSSYRPSDSALFTDGNNRIRRDTLPESRNGCFQTPVY